MNFKSLSLIATVALMVAACGGNGGSNKQADNSETKQAIDVPAFNADSAFAFAKKQVDFGPRVPNTKASDQCASWMHSTLKRFTPDVFMQNFSAKAFDGTLLKGRNVIASFNKDATARILLCAHWDSRPWADHDPDPANHKKPIDGANDGASGVAVLLEVARQLSLKQPTVGVDIVLFDLEDYGPNEGLNIKDSEKWWALGSQYWSKNPHVQGYRARYGILLDMVGVKNPNFMMEGISMYYASDVVKKVWNHAAALGFSDNFPMEEGAPITDDHLYINTIANIPSIDIIHLERDSQNGAFYPYWHTLGDNISQVDKNSLGMVGQVLLRTIFYEL